LAQSTAKICICQKFAVPLQPKATKGYNIMNMKMYKKPITEVLNLEGDYLMLNPVSEGGKSSEYGPIDAD
jgi:hypothetical protein